MDLLPSAGGHLVLELNGAAEFDDTYTLPGSRTSAFAAAAAALRLPR